MPTFTTDQVTHPNPCVGRCHAIDVLLPKWDEAVFAVQAYLSEDFQRSVVSKKLAQRLNLTLQGQEATGEIVIQTYFEGAPVIHRSRPMLFTFRLADERAGDAYIHLDLDDLGEFVDVYRYDPKSMEMGTNTSFLALRPDDPDTFCIIIPMER